MKRNAIYILIDTIFSPRVCEQKSTRPSALSPGLPRRFHNGRYFHGNDFWCVWFSVLKEVLSLEGGSHQQQQSSQELRKGKEEVMNIESWCTVELNSKQDWLRANRKHNTNAFASSVFKGDSNQHQASRLDFKSSPEKHRERRHFPDKGKTILKFS